MTTQLTPSFWIEAVIVPALAVVTVFGGAGALAARLRSGQRRRALWLAAFVATGLFLLCFATGADRWLQAAKTPPRPEPTFVVRGNLPVGDTTPTGSVAAQLSGELAMPAEAPAKPVDGPTQTLWPAWLWLGGILLVLGRVAGQRIAFGLGILRQSGEAGSALSGRVRELAARLGMRRGVRVRVVPDLLGPAAFGSWRPTVFVPEGFETAHAARKRDAMLAHELAHLAACDPFWHGAARLLVAVLWWHPLAWWALGRLRSASEAAADEASLVIENGPSELAACLVALGARLQGQRIGWLGMAGNGFRSELGRRVERLLSLPAGESSWRRSRSAGLGTAGLAVLGAGGLLAVTAWALPAGDEARPTLLAAAQQVLGPTSPAESTAGETEPPSEAPGTTALMPQPVTPGPAPAPVASQVVDVTVGAGGRFLLNQREVSLDELSAAVASMRKRDPELVVRLGTDKATGMNSLVPVLDRLTAMGIPRISLRTQPASEGSADAAPPPPGMAEEDATRSPRVEPPAVLSPGPAVGGGFSAPGATPPPATGVPGTASSLPPEESIAGTNLLTRAYRLNSHLALRSLERSGADLSTNGVTAASLRELFAAAGVDWGGTNTYSAAGEGAGFRSPTGKAFFFNLGTGAMVVRATPADLELIESALSILTAAPQQVTIEARFVEITGDAYENLGFDWFLGSASIDGKTILSPGVAIPETTPTNALTGIRVAVPASAQSSEGGVFPGTVPNPVGTTNVTPQTAAPPIQVLRGDQLNWSGRNVAGATNLLVNATLDGQVTGVLDEAQYRTLLKAMEQREGVNIMAAPRVTTLDGRQAQIQIVDLRSIVTGLDSAAAKEGVNTQEGATNAPPYKTVQIPVGPTLDVVPHVDPDGRTINLTLLATLTEFLGYDDPAQFQPLVGRLASPVPLPRFRIRQASTEVRIKDGHTVVLGGMTASEVQRAGSKVPTLGDLPLVGEHFRSEGKQEVRKNLLVFVTAYLIDPAGNRIHPVE